MPSDVDPDILTDAILMHVEDLGDGGEAWLKTEFERVLQAVLAGDEFITATAFKGQSSEAERDVPAKQLLAVLTQARKRLGSADSSAAGAMLIPRLADFPLN